MAAFSVVPTYEPGFAALKAQEDAVRTGFVAGLPAPAGFLVEVTPALKAQIATSRSRARQANQEALTPGHFVAPLPLKPDSGRDEQFGRVRVVRGPGGLRQESGPPSSFVETFLDTLPAHVRNHLVLAGGAVTNSILKLGKPSDYDLFLVDLQEPLVLVLELLERWLPSCYYAMRTAYALTLKMFSDDKQTFNVQLVLRVYRSAAEVVTGFDLDASGCCYHQGRYWVTPRCLYSLSHNVLHVDLDRLSSTYNSRLAKYYHTKGFDVVVPVPVETQHLLFALSRKRDVLDSPELRELSLVGLCCLLQSRRRYDVERWSTRDYCPISLDYMTKENWDLNVNRDAMHFFSDKATGGVIGYGFSRPHLESGLLLGLDSERLGLLLCCRGTHAIGDRRKMSMPEQVEFVTSNPGSQHTASFDPRQTSWAEWVQKLPMAKASGPWAPARPETLPTRPEMETAPLPVLF